MNNVGINAVMCISIILGFSVSPIRAELTNSLFFYAPYEETLQNTVAGMEVANAKIGDCGLTSEAARFGQGALSVNGNAQQDAGLLYEDENNQFDFGDSDFTVSAWVRLSNVTDRQQIITMNRDSSVAALQLRVQQGFLMAYFFGGNADGTLDFKARLDPADWQDQWVHMAFVCSRAEGGRLYVNGVERAALPRISTRYAAKAANIRVGSYGASKGLSLRNALVDEVAVWKRALSADEVAELQKKALK
ncbi:MAG: LamG domain-containing protein [Kiritimatiellales bacterium]